MEKTYKGYLVALILLITISFLPLFIISHYNHPSVDDYGYSMDTYHIWNEKHDLMEVLKTAVDTSAYYYNNWQGLYISGFLLALQPAIFGEGFYAITGYLMLFLLLGSNLYFCSFVIRKIGGNFLEAITLASALSFLSIQWMPSATQGLYWFNGAVNYGFFHALLLLFICWMIELQGRKGKAALGLTIACCLVAIIITGGNHVTMLMVAVAACCITIAGIIKFRWEKLKYNLPVVISSIVGMMVNALAPGTAVRQSHFGRLSAFKAICLSVLNGISKILEWADLKIFLMAIILLPIMWGLIKRIRNCGFMFRYPLLVFIGGVMWISCMFCPSLYAIGSTGPGRLLNLVYFHFVILFFVNFLYLLGWLSVKFKIDSLGELKFSRSWLVTALLLGIGLGVSFGYMGEESAWGWKAYRELTKGIVQRYSAQAFARDEVFRESKGKDVVVKSFSDKSEVLFFDGITEDENDWRNLNLSKYYQLNSVVEIY